MLIDLEDVVKLDTHSEAPFAFPSWKHRSVLESGTVYTVRSDLKQVGHMIAEAGDSNRAIQSFQQDLISGDISTLDDAIKAADVLLLSVS
jgi:hypothetical protein